MEPYHAYNLQIKNNLFNQMVLGKKWPPTQKK